MRYPADLVFGISIAASQFARLLRDIFAVEEDVEEYVEEEEKLKPIYSVEELNELVSARTET